MMRREASIFPHRQSAEVYANNYMHSSFDDLRTATAAIKLADIEFNCVLCGIRHTTDYTAWRGCVLQLQRIFSREEPIYLFPGLRKYMQCDMKFPWRLFCYPSHFNTWSGIEKDLEDYASQCLLLDLIDLKERGPGPKTRSVLNDYLPWLALSYDAFSNELRRRRQYICQMATDKAAELENNVDKLLTELAKLEHVVTSMGLPQGSKFPTVRLSESHTNLNKAHINAAVGNGPGAFIIASTDSKNAPISSVFVPEEAIIQRLRHDFGDILSPPVAQRRYSLPKGSAMARTQQDCYPSRCHFALLQHLEFTDDGLYIAIKDHEYIYMFPKSFPIRKQLYHAILIRDYVYPEYIGTLKNVVSASNYSSAVARAVPLAEVRQPILLDDWSVDGPLEMYQERKVDCYG